MNVQPIDIDSTSLLDPQILADPYDFYAALHEQRPVYRMPETGFYVVSRYDDLRQVLRDTETFSSDVDRASAMQGPRAAIHREILAARGWRQLQILQRADPPKHQRHRKLVERVFTPTRVRELVPRIEAEARRLVDGLTPTGSCEFIADYAMPLPGIIIAEQIGLGTDYRRFKSWADAMVAPGHSILTEDELRQAAETELEAQHFLADLFEQRRARPENDIISGLVHSHGSDEQPLTMEELQSIMWQIISAGFHTTTQALAHTMWALLRFPEVMQSLRADSSLIHAVVEESLRFEGPVQGLRRQVTHDTEIAGVPIPKGAIVITRYAAANRDPAKFVCPHRFNPARENIRAHVAFGYGPHFCIGAALARQEIQTGLLEFLRRTENIKLSVERPAHLPSFANYVMRELPLAFESVRSNEYDNTAT
jgi:cytochrome P450